MARKAMIESCAGADDSKKSEIRAAYEAFGFYRTDIRELRSLFWWRRMQAVVRLEHLRFAEAAGKVALLINDSNNDVRMAAVSMLAAVKHPALKDLLPELFEANSRWSYKYLINVIYLAEIPAEHIESFVFSEDRDRRKAAAILLGRRGSDESVTMLAVLSEDGVKDVRREAAKSLARAGTPGARALLFDMTMDKNPQIRAEAAKGLGAMGGDSTVPFLEKLALGESFEERYQAFKALAGLGEKGLASIRNLAERQPEMARQFLSAGSMERERQ
ncbi:MAG TPA: HEAT repeat domain-containing protein [bacterium]|nr:HEAT repeat domain-containing protein [bacterium]